MKNEKLKEFSKIYKEKTGKSYEEVDSYETAKDLWIFIKTDKSEEMNRTFHSVGSKEEILDTMSDDSIEGYLITDKNLDILFSHGDYPEIESTDLENIFYVGERIVDIDSKLAWDDWEDMEEYMTRKIILKTGEKIKWNNEIWNGNKEISETEIENRLIELGKNRETALEMVKIGELFKYVDPNIEGYREIVLEIVQERGNLLKYASEELRGDKEVVLEAVKQRGYALEYASENLKGDKEVVLEAVRKSGYALEYTSENLKGDKEVVLEAVKQSGDALKYANEKLKGDKEVVLEAVRKSGYALQYASEELRKDKEVVLEAVKNNGNAIEYTNEKLKGDKEVVLEAVKNNGYALLYISEELRGDKEVILEAVENCDNALWYASEELQIDKEFILEALQYNKRLILYHKEGLLYDEEFKKKIERIRTEEKNHNIEEIQEAISDRREVQVNDTTSALIEATEEKLTEKNNYKEGK